MPAQPVRSRSGTIAVTTTERGLPTALKIDASELKKPPQQLAREILELCRLSALRAQVAHRRELAEQGADPNVVRAMRLATADELARAEEEMLGNEDELPATWMRSV